MMRTHLFDRVTTTIWRLQSADCQGRVISLGAGSAGHFVRFDDPAAADRLVQVDHRLELDLLTLRVLQLGIEQAAFGVEDLDEAGVAVLIAQACRIRILL